MTKIQFFTLTACIAIFASSATPVLAVVGRGGINGLRNATAAGKVEARIENREEARFARLGEKAGSEITRRLEALNKLITRIQAMVRLNQTQKDALISQVRAEIAALNTLKDKIGQDTDLTTLKTDVQSITKSYRIFAMFIPKIQIIAHADRLLTVIEELGKLTEKLQARIDELNAAGKDTSAMKALMEQRAAKIAEAKAQAENAISAVLPLTPDGWPGNKEILKSARTMLQNARHLIQDGHKLAQQVRQGLGDAVKPTRKPTPTP